MDASFADAISKVFEEGGATGAASSSVKQFTNNVTASVELAQQLKEETSPESELLVSVSQLKIRTVELVSLAPSEAAADVAKIQESLTGIDGALGEIQEENEDPNSSLNRILSTDQSKVKYLRDGQETSKILEGWANFIRNVESLNSLFDTRVKTFEDRISQLEQAPVSGSFVSDVIEEVGGVKNAYKAYRSQIVEMADLVLKSVTGDDEVSVTIRANIRKLLESLPEDLVVIFEIESSFRYAVHGLRLLCQLGQSRRAFLIDYLKNQIKRTRERTLQVGYQSVIDSLSEWKDLWNFCLDTISLIESSNCAKTSLNKGYANNLIVQLDGVTSVIEEQSKTWDDLYRYGPSLLSPEVWLEFKTYMSVFRNWGDRLKVFLSAIEAFTADMDCVDRRSLYLANASYDCDSYKKAVNDVSNVISDSRDQSSSSYIPNPAGNCLDMKSDLDDLREIYGMKTSGVEPGSSLFTVSFSRYSVSLGRVSDFLDGVLSCLATIQSMTDIASPCGELVSDMINTCSACRSACSRCSDYCSSLTRSSAIACSNSDALSQILEALAGVLNFILSNVITHGFKYHQGDVIIDGNVLIMKNLVVLQNTVSTESHTSLGPRLCLSYDMVYRDSMIGWKWFLEHFHGNGNMGSPTTPPL